MNISEIASNLYRAAKKAATGVWIWRAEWSAAMKKAWRKLMTQGKEKIIQPRLYKKIKTGDVQLWDVYSYNCVVVVVFGRIGGKMQSKSTICEGKNIGRANETTPEKQAETESVAKWKKQIKAGYVEDPSGESEIKLPMKVKRYQDQKGNIRFPVYASPKLDGVNGEWRKTSSGLKLISRGGEEFSILEHEVAAVESTMNRMKTNSLNVELYCHGMFLEEITSAVKKHNENTPRIQSFLFELPTVNIQYGEKLDTLIPSSLLPKIQVITLWSHEEIDRYHDKCVAGGYEGIVIRHPECLYEYGVRSSDVFKYKIPDDAEFKIISCSVDKNGHPVFVMDNPKGKTPKHKTFKVKPKGTDEQRKKIVEEFEEEYLEAWYTVEFEKWSMYGVPLKPVGCRLRECDSNGEPLD